MLESSKRIAFGYFDLSKYFSKLYVESYNPDLEI